MKRRGFLGILGGAAVAGPAEAWVRDGKEHETGLYIEDGKVRYALPEMREG